MSEVIGSSLQCGCQHHAVNLRLENNRKSSSAQGLKAPSYTPLRVVFSNSVNVPGAIPSTWREIEIKRLEESLPTPTPVTLGPPQSCPLPQAKRRVRFGLMEVRLKGVPSGPPIKVIAPAQALPSMKTVVLQATQTQDLCITIAQLPSHAEDCVGYLLDSSQQKYGIYTKSSNCTQHHWTSCTLDQILMGTAKQIAPFTLRDKLKVAIDLTSGVPQLHKTPWLSEDWGKTDVAFIKRPGDPKASTYEHPFVYREMSQATSGLSTMSSSISYRVIRNKALYTLGTIFIELCYGKRLQDLQEPEDWDCNGTWGVEWCTADRLIRTKDLENQIGKRYADAVRRCVYCDFGTDDADLEVESFQQAVYEGILEKLEESLQHIEG